MTLSWHWYADEAYGSAFYTDSTRFNLAKAMNGQDPAGYQMLLDGIDAISAQLARLQEAGVPVLWRPLHEADGNWFWWGAKGPETVRGLWRLMYDRYTRVHGLNNLIWVWNSPVPACYPGDDVVDIISRDMYPPEHLHTAQLEKLAELKRITTAEKIALIGEIGTIPSIQALADEKAEWVSYMTWCGDFTLTEKWTTNEVLREMYQHPWAVTRDKLPV